MVRKLIIFTFIIAHVFLLTGCWNYSEIDEDIIVAGFAVDKGEEGYKYLLTAELIAISGAGPAPEIQSRTVHVNGETIFEAIRNLISITSKKSFFGHCRAIILSNEIAEEGINDVIDFVVRDHETRKSINLVVSKLKTAKEILASHPLTTAIVSYELSQMLSGTEESLSKSTKVLIPDVLNTMIVPGQEFTLPAVETVKIMDKETFKLDGIAVFEKDKLIDYLSDDESKYYNFIINKIKGGTVVIKNIDDKPSSNLSFEIYKNNTAIDYAIENNELHFTVKVKSVLGVANLPAGVDYSDAEQREKLKYLVEKQIEDDLEKLITKVQKEIKVDIFGFGKEIYENNPKLWKQYEDNWNDKFSDLKIDVVVTATIKSTGQDQNKTQGE